MASKSTSQTSSHAGPGTGAAYKDFVSALAAFEGNTAVFEMFDTLPINVMYCGTDLAISYINRKSRETLEGIESLLPVPASKVVGSSIDVFHKNPAHQRRILSNPRNLPHRATIQLGAESLDLHVFPVFNGNDYTGIMVCWDVVTARLQAENMNAQYASMVSSMPLNVMLCDNDFIITYINPRSLSTLQSIERLLPCRASEIVGKSIDFFHKNPTHQRAILNNAKNFPHRAKIHLGDEILSFFASLVVDANGVRQGTMVTWDVITESERIKQVVERDLSSATQDIVGRASSVAQGGQALAATTEQMNAAIEELTASINSIAQNARGADGIAKATHREAEVGSKAISKAIEAMDLISRSSEDIADIIKVISEIASQTNLLAFNAAIEAARAGEHGLGFSVVADEVRKLAERSSQAAKEISKLIHESVKRIAQGGETSRQAGDAFEKIVAGVSKTTQSITEISTATDEQLIAAREVSQSIQHVAEETERAAAAAESIASNSRNLDDVTNQLKKLFS